MRLGHPIGILCSAAIIRWGGSSPFRRLTRQMTLPTSSATSSAPLLSIATPTGRPIALLSRPIKPLRISCGRQPGQPIRPRSPGESSHLGLRAWLTISKAGRSHLCIDMQRMFSEGTPWQAPWIPKVFDQVAEIATRFPDRTIFTRFVTPSSPERPGMWRTYCA